MIRTIAGGFNTESIAQKEQPVLGMDSIQVLQTPGGNGAVVMADPNASSGISGTSYSSDNIPWWADPSYRWPYQSGWWVL